jgi:pyrimidine operon attenuation protein / uracil phosphoribosyltransferase
MFAPPIMQDRVLLNSKLFGITIQRLCYQLIENHNDFSSTVIIGLQPRGIYLAKRIKESLEKIAGLKPIVSGNLDVTFYRDDFRRRDELILPSATQIEFIIEDKNVILIDDVLYTGRSIRAGMDALMAFGRPKKIELAVLIDRRYSRHVPVEPDFVGKQVDTIASEKVIVTWKETEGEDKVILTKREK